MFNAASALLGHVCPQLLHHRLVLSCLCQGRVPFCPVLSVNFHVCVCVYCDNASEMQIHISSKCSYL